MDFNIPFDEAGGVYVQHIDLPALDLGVPAVHPEQFRCKQTCLIPACTSPDFHDYIFVINFKLQSNSSFFFPISQ